MLLFLMANVAIEGIYYMLKWENLAWAVRKRCRWLHLFFVLMIFDDGKQKAFLKSISRYTHLINAIFSENILDQRAGHNDHIYSQLYHTRDQHPFFPIFVYQFFMYIQIPGYEIGRASCRERVEVRGVAG